MDVVGEYVRLTRRGGSNYFGLCPFHNERTPSFSVSADKQIFHCFGCGKGGGVIGFVMAQEGLPFRDAVEILAKRANMPMPAEEESEESSRRKVLLSLNRDAARFYYEQLCAGGGKAAQAYVTQRQITVATVKNFGLGFAPDSWDSLSVAMHAKGYTNRDLLEAGLAKNGRNGSIYDAFRNRLMFPVIDVRGSVIGFSGRIIGGEGAKYINSPDTQVYVKGNNLFAINLAKTSKEPYFLLVEGNVDVVSLHQAGFPSAVASLGTALTPAQARLMSQYKKEVVICYDSDTAGKNATQKAIRIFSELDMRVRVLQIPDAKDPDEFIKSNGAEAFRNLLEESGGQMDYRLQLIESEHPLTSPESRTEYLREAVKLLASLDRRTEREVYVATVAEKAGVSRDAVLQETERQRKQNENRRTKEKDRKFNRPVQMAQPAQKEFRYDNVRSAMAEEGVIRTLVLNPELAKSQELPDAALFTSNVLAKFYREVTRRIQSGESLSVGVLEGVFSPEEMSHFLRVTRKAEDAANSEKAFCDYVKTIRDKEDPEEDLLALAAAKKKNDNYGGYMK